MNKTPTLDDVAAEASVSAATVSRYLNRPGVVAPTTAARIQTAIAATGYIPNLLAGGLASNRSRLVAVLTPRLAGSIFNDTIEAMANELSAAGASVMLGLTGADDARTDQLVRAAISRRADAIVSTDGIPESAADLVRRSPTLFIQLWELPDDPIGMAVGFSHRDAGRDIARYLAMRGYRRPHVITAAGSRASQRRDGFAAQWQAQGGGPLSEHSVDIPFRFSQARSCFEELRRLETMPDVVVCGSDDLAQGLIVEAQAGRLRVPDDIAVVGFGNSSLAGDMRPTITTVDIDGTRIAREAIAAVRRHADGEEPTERRIDVGFRLVARESA